MKSTNGGRVLQRMGARELALDEIQKVRAALITLLSVIITGGGQDEHHDS